MQGENLNKMKFIKEDLENLYGIAIESYKNCINDKDNEFLKDEVNIPLEEIVYIEKEIKIIFTKKIFEQYVLETSLMLYNEEKEIGKYLYISNEKGDCIDDFLVFS